MAQLARADGVRWVSLDAPVQHSANKFSTWATTNGTVVANGFRNYTNILSPIGINNTYGYGAGGVKGAFGGFLPEYTPGQTVTKVEVALRLYVSTSLQSTETPKLTAYVNGQAGSVVLVPAAQVAACVGASKACTQYFDITATRSAWKWSDFATLQILIDQSLISSKKTVYHDAVGVRITTGTGTDATTPLVLPSNVAETPINTSVLANTFNQTVRATNIWNEAPYRQGAGVTVAVVDSGNFRTNAIGARFIGEINFNSAEHTANDKYGHGTFVTGIMADDGIVSGGKYSASRPRSTSWACA